MEQTFPDHERRMQVLHRIRRELGPNLLGAGTPTCWLQQDAVVPCSIPALEWALGMAGLPRGHIVEMLGAEHAGKSTLALAIAAGAQSAGAIVAWIDAGHQFDPSYAFSFGVHGEELLISRPHSAEQALGIITALVRSEAVDLIVLDSVSAMIPQSDVSTSPPAEPSGSTRFVLLRALLRMHPWVRRSRCCLLFLDQMTDREYADAGIPETTACTRTMTPFSSARIVLRRIWKRDTSRPGTHARALLTVAKNRLGPRGRATEIGWDLRNGRIFETAGSRIDPSIVTHTTDAN